MTVDWWTLGFQAVNVLVLVWLLGHFFWKPVSAMIEQRRVAAGQTLADAEAQRALAAAALADIARTRAGFVEERNTLLADAHAAAELAHTARIEAAMQQATDIEARAHEAAAKEKAAAESAWRGSASALAIDIASRLCAPLAGPALQAAFLVRLLDKLRALSEAERHGIAAAGVALDVVSAAPLAAEDADRARQQIAEALGAAPQFVFAVEPALVAGLELRGPHLLVSNSWSADLQHIRSELAHDIVA
ncbi:MAG: F0F1 ATP synthase subunit delta [Variovorax sp.]|nr:F0F1 ATP synthase subunit delta [Variovorax sp.]